MNLSLKSFRKKLRISAQELAREAEIHASTLSRLENGWTPMTDQFVDQIILGFERLGVKTSWSDINSVAEGQYDHRY
jgi:transcriptional regulator with XRE-family HTH domain